MTTVIRTRIPLEALSMSQSQQPTARRRSKRLAAYDEEDGDFVFTRGSKRTKIAPVEIAPVPVLAPNLKKGRENGRKDKAKQKESDDELQTTQETSKKPRGRKMGLATPGASNDTISVPKRRKPTRSSVGKSNGESSTYQGTHDYDSIDMVGETPYVAELSKSAVDLANQGQSTVISLPFSDTPIINRNKELRKKGAGGARRSSLGMRGRRASSLIDNGHSAIPHREVESKEFYKHIESEGLSEPRRMKQLLTWTGERALGGKVAHGDSDSGAKHAARMIEEALLKGFANKSEFSDWFSREESVPTTIIKKPNPRNVEIEENLTGLEARIKLLKEERDQWKSLSKLPPSLPPLLPNGTASIAPSCIDASLLDPEQAAILTTITSASASTLLHEATVRLQKLQEGLEFNVDRFRDGVHKLEQYQGTVNMISERVLGMCAGRLEERDRREREVVGTRDLPMQEVLRSLSRILPEGSSNR